MLDEVAGWGAYEWITAAAAIVAVLGGICALWWWMVRRPEPPRQQVGRDGANIGGDNSGDIRIGGGRDDDQ